MILSPDNFLVHIKNLVTGGGRTGGEPVHDAGYLKRAEGVTLQSLVDTSALVAHETNARVILIEQTVDTAGSISFPIPRDYDEATDEFRLRVLASQLTLSVDDDVKLDVELYRKRAGTALSADLAPSFTSDPAVPILSVAEQWVEFDLSQLTFLRDDVATIEVITNGLNDTDGEEVLIHAVELVYRTTLVSYDDEDDAQGNPLR